MRSVKLVILFLLSFSWPLLADEHTTIFDSANAQYAKTNYAKAIELYQDLVNKNIASSELYYNLGNAYYKTGEIGKSILFYERAKKLSPNDEDIAYNLKFANQKTEDKIEAAPQLFLTEWKNDIFDLMTGRWWALCCILFAVFSFLLFSTYIVSSGKTFRQLSFYSGSFFFILTIFVFFIAKNKYTLETNSTEAIVTSPSVTVTGSPTEKGTKLFMLHEGTKIRIIEENTDWCEIKIANGNTGWIKNSMLQKI